MVNSCIGQLQRAHEDAVARLEVRNSLGANAYDSETTGWIESDSTLADAQLTGNYDDKKDVVTKVPYCSCYQICRSERIFECQVPVQVASDDIYEDDTKKQQLETCEKYFDVSKKDPSSGNWLSKTISQTH